MMRACPLCCICVALSLCVPALGQQRLPGFGLTDGGDHLPGFGEMSASSLKIVAQDRTYAVAAMCKIDANKDGVMTREELRISRHKKYEERYFRYDANRNRQLTVSELAGYYARIRVDKVAAARAGARQHHL